MCAVAVSDGGFYILVDCSWSHGNAAQYHKEMGRKRWREGIKRRQINEREIDEREIGMKEGVRERESE